MRHFHGLRQKLDKETLGYGQEDLTMYVQYPTWYNLVSHNAMEHTVHHVNPRVPTYNLARAQAVLKVLIGDELVTVPFSIIGILKTMKLCKLYDYENHCWLDFNGQINAEIDLLNKEIIYANAA